MHFDWFSKLRWMCVCPSENAAFRIEDISRGASRMASHIFDRIDPSCPCWNDAGRGPYLLKETDWIKSVADLDYRLVFDFCLHFTYLKLLPAPNRDFLKLRIASFAF
jgi:hypothetical protein